MFEFDRINCLINGSGILAESATLNTQNSLAPNYQVGKRGIASISPNGPIKTTFNFSYVPVLDYDHAYLMINTLKTLVDDSLVTGTTIEVAGITGFNCYLQSYSLKADPNQIVKAQASYISYDYLSGTVRVKNATPTMNPGNSISWGATTYVTTSTGYFSTPTYGFSYDFQAEFQPIYTLWKHRPTQVNFMAANESMTFIRDDFIPIAFSGQDAYNTGNAFIVNSGTEDPFVNLVNIAFTCNDTGDAEAQFPMFAFNISGAKMTNTEMSARVDDYLKSTTTIVNYY